MVVFLSELHSSFNRATPADHAQQTGGHGHDFGTLAADHSTGTTDAAELAAASPRANIVT